MILFLHNRYRIVGGEERTVADLLWLVREHLREPAELLERDSAAFTRGAAAAGLLRGGLQPRDVASAVRLGGARVVHAHNLHPAFGWRALAAARAAGARVVLHLHQYRLVCAIGVCYTRGADCTRCHGRNTLAGVRLNCRASHPEALAYGLALPLWQRRLIANADALIVPSVFARERLRALGAPLPFDRLHVLAPPVRALAESSPPEHAQAADAPAADGQSAGEARAGVPPGPARSRRYALVVSRLAAEKGIDIAIAACRIARMPLVVAGEGPERESLQRLSADADVRFVGHVGDAELRRLRAGAAVALMPSLWGETFGMAAAEAMAAELPVAASRAGALPELVDPLYLAPPGDAVALADMISRAAGDALAGRRARERARALCAPQVIAGRLADVYDRAGRA